VAAGGRGERSRSPIPKQFVTLAGRPVFAWCLDRLREVGCDPIVLVVPGDRIDKARSLLTAEAGITVTQGGDTRQASVAAGLECVETEIVLVHDAVRPFVDKQVVSQLFDALQGVDGAIPVLPIGETIKEVGGASVVRTVDRAGLATAQTPQAFFTQRLKEAHRRAREESFVGIDDAELIERYGGTVRTIRGTRANLKLTWPEDFALAEAMMKHT
jgi:2-C-methyl-D-erythritol 4-phosphate cytidylyltransferase / 2-C-methyl-D-erythritol 2,4-cyclodiphosphate synthase